jgi:hypothetical protein
LRVKDFFEQCVSPLSKPGLLFPLLNALYFGSILIGALLVQFSSVTFYEMLYGEGGVDLSLGAPLLIVSIFLFNLAVSSFILTTLPGLVFFALPLGVLVWRAVLWSSLMSILPLPDLLLAFPTFVLEGEAYVIAAFSGIILGLSWLKPTWVLKGEKLSRREAFRKVVVEASRLYVLVALLLLISAVVETATIYFVQ